MTELISTTKISNNDYEYCFNIFNSCIDKQVYNGKYKYYYQYEMDSSQTLYEYLMNNNAIAISARSYKEAMVLNAILRTIIDGHTYSLECYTEDADIDVPSNSFFECIEKSDSMKQYKGFISSTLKKIKPLTYLNKHTNVKHFSSPYIFNMENIKKLINDSTLLDSLKKNKKADLQYVFDMSN